MLIRHPFYGHSATPGKRPPQPPPTAVDDTRAGLPWFEYFDDERVALEGAVKIETGADEEARPQGREPVPGAVGGLVDALALRQVVVLGADAREPGKR
ncbi:MAG: hypothetical protein EOM91_14345 [Sphingobacteriia bacterium]|nr:hypothetical protein [Sphingobacteriia bacterium]NCC40597.1 hypothetical protein [Gammaproteobacteria bacterium]